MRRGTLPERNTDLWAGTQGRYTFDEIDHHIRFREDAIRTATARLLVETPDPLIDLVAAIDWQAEQLSDLYQIRSLMEKANEERQLGCNPAP